MEKINKIVNKSILKKHFSKLYPICRSIMGKGFVDSINILSSIEKLKLIKVKSGSKVLDWTVPLEWNIKDGFIKYKDKKIVDFKKHSLHVINYSIPVDKKINYKTLKDKIFTISNLPNAIPYIHTYYKRDWGFSMKYNQFKKLNKKGIFHVKINSEHKKGNLIYSDNLIKGKSKKEILFYTYLCHPQMANHELAGPLLWIYLYKYLKNFKKKLRYSYRFVCAPENIGAAAFLHKNKKSIKKKIHAGYIINCVGNGNNYTYKKSRQGNSTADIAALNVLSDKKNVDVVDFFPDGSDERQFCSPGFDLPIGLVMRKMYGRFKEYHTSLDDEKFINFNTILESLNTYIELIETHEFNFIPIAKIKYGTPQLSKLKNFNLYPMQMDFKSKPRSIENRFLLDLLNYSDGKKDLLNILGTKYKLVHMKSAIEQMLKFDLIRKKK